jgi:hypothetical protein
MRVSFFFGFERGASWFSGAILMLFPRHWPIFHLAEQHSPANIPNRETSWVCCIRR